ncbi:serine/threonine protein kinase, negative regulator of sexual conjugation and meiosis [Lentinula boryana]|uniref:Serine/threonine protein kinase, negative regulator of sexual conjugation and meiosis n=1 Tax=Lentinula boryana TaxID=40481 RepID=A0ABQ8QKN6_9AGAR|nr:serine/threonine protein kinase, negative regulator of sexual conjugation and meiosis [Lentinula boryana]
MPTVKATSHMPDFASQEILDGRFRLLDLLGAGSYGKVYKAFDNQPKSFSSARYYAVKVLLKADKQSRDYEMQLRELKLHKKVSFHPNIVTFCGAFEENDYLFVVLEYCEGNDLFTAIVDKGIFERNDQLIKSSYVKLVDAVYYCHQQGVFHRDLKPENILCSVDGSDIWLADFGLSTNRRVCHDFGCGSKAYMSPECIGKETNNVIYSAPLNDIWSLGVILVNLVTQHNPWNYAHSSDPCFDAFLANRDSLRDALPISDSLNSILKRIFDFNPVSRINLPTLRNEILSLETFYAPNDQIDNPDTNTVPFYLPDEPTDSVKLELHPAVDGIKVEVEVEVDVEVVAGSLQRSSTSSMGSTSWSNIEWNELKKRLLLLQGVLPPRPKLFVVGSHSISRPHSSNSQDDLLVTPPYGPVDLAIDVPEINEDSSDPASPSGNRPLPRFTVKPPVAFQAGDIKFKEMLPEPVRIVRRMEHAMTTFSI